MKIEMFTPREIAPYARNPRQNDAAMAKVAASIKEFGFRQPIVVDKDMVIIAGHTRWAAAGLLKLKQVPVHIATELSPTQVKAYRLADNRTNQESHWDYELLDLEIEDLRNEDFDLELTGFDLKELERKDTAEPPEDFQSVDDNIEVKNECPKCHYEW